MPLYENVILSEWLDSAGPLPSRDDFDPGEGCLDALTAWQNFGGLIRTEAFDKFCSSPAVYQEDFMFMGTVAFAFYFPIVERYVFQASADDDGEVEAIWILAHCIIQQLSYPTDHHVLDLRARIVILTQHVRGNLSKFCIGPSEQTRLDEAWRQLGERLGSYDRRAN